MQTALEQPVSATRPRLRREAQGDAPAELISLDKLPLTLGRGGSADVKVESGRVSRRHAQITCEHGEFRIRDLGSTNGTIVNDRPISDATLGDGDRVLIADVTFTFVAQPGEGNDATDEASERDDNDSALSDANVVLAMRQLQEILTHRSLDVLFERVVALDGRELIGCEALARHETFVDNSARDHRELKTARRKLLGASCRMTARMCHLQRLLAVEAWCSQGGEGLLFLGLGAAELAESAGLDALEASLESLGGLIEPGKLVLQLPPYAAGEETNIAKLVERLNERGFGTAYENVGGDGHPLEGRHAAADFVKLHSSLADGKFTNERRREIESVIHTAGDIGARVIAQDVRDAEQAELFQELGCHAGQGEYFKVTNG